MELTTISTLPRRDMRPLGHELAKQEGDRGGMQWCADAPTEPVPEVYFGQPTSQEYGKITRELAPSRLSSQQVERTFVDFLASSPQEMQ